MHRCKRLKLADLLSILSDAGYELIFTHRTRAELVAILTIAVNQIAHATDQQVWKVYRRLRDRLLYLRRGERFIPKNSASLRAWRPGDEDGSPDDYDDGRPSVCPCCGQVIPDEGPHRGELDPLDPQESPQSSGREVE